MTFKRQINELTTIKRLLIITVCLLGLSLFTSASSQAGNLYKWVGSIDIPDNSVVWATINVSDNYAMADVNVMVAVEHTYDADLNIWVESPWGTVVELSTDNGGGWHYGFTWFDDEADTDIRDGYAPFMGYYRPEGCLSDFDGENAGGVWTIEVEDDFYWDTGTLGGFMLDITPVSVPLPGALLLFGSGLAGLLGLKRGRKKMTEWRKNHGF